MMSTAIDQVRACLATIKPGLDIESIGDDAPLLEQRIISSFDVLDLLLHLEHASGRPTNRAQLAPGSFRDIRTIARVFIDGEPIR